MSSFVITALPAGAVDMDVPVAVEQRATERQPCRRCLRDAKVGEALVLAPYNPFTRTSPYAGEGPVFVHANGCEPFRSVPDTVSEQVHGRVLAVRAYDADAMMTEAAVLPGEGFVDHIAARLTDEHVAFLHVHFAGPGCFAFRVDRA